MKTNVEKQVAAFDKVIGHCNAFGATYNPSKVTMKVTALTAMLTTAQQTILAVDTAKSARIVMINARQQAFNPLPRIATRILSAVWSTDASPQLIADVKLYCDKLRAQSRGGPTSTVTPVNSSQVPTIPADPSRGPLSELDFESKIKNFNMIIQLLLSEASYKPNEVDLSIAALNAVVVTLREKHKAVMNAQIVLTNARLARKKAVYDVNGIYGTAKRVKKYILSVYGATSDQFHQIDSIHFRNK